MAIKTNKKIHEKNHKLTIHTKRLRLMPMCTLEKHGSLFILTLIGDDHEHRLRPSLIDSLLSALSQVNSQAINGGSALITVAHGKFFCNGFDIRVNPTLAAASTRWSSPLDQSFLLSSPSPSPPSPATPLPADWSSRSATTTSS